MSATNDQMESLASATTNAEVVKAEEARYGLSQFQLMWRKFKRSKPAIIAGIVVILLYMVALFANFLAPYGGDQRNTDLIYVPPVPLKFDFNTGLYINPLEKKVDIDTLLTTYTPILDKQLPIKFFIHDQPYQLLGFIDSDVHLFGVEDKNSAVFLLGSDRQGRDLLSRIILGSQMSLTIGLVGVFLSLIIGSIMGTASGFFGGWIDNLIQRLIEVIRSFPSIPLWMALSAALPQSWGPQQVYFSITVILSFIGWTWLARQLRGKVLALREEEFVNAALLSGASDTWIIFRHLIPAVLGHIIVITTLALPGMILAESTLSFLNLGLRPPMISWGVLLNEAQSLEVIRHYPWLLFPAVAIATTVLAFNFFGDGLRDAADPYSL
jgi:peptide/nickel transport system permease protein